MSQNNTYDLQALANDGSFRRRLKGLLASMAWQMLNEDVATPGHSARAGYARSVLANLDQSVSTIAGWLVTRTNIAAATTSVSLDLGAPVVATDASDAAILSQLATDWSLIAGA